MTHASRRQRTHRRTGAVLIVVLVVLSVVLSILGATVAASLREHAECRTERQLLQIQFLCEAGFLRTIEQLRANPDFTGEEWTPELSDDSEATAHLVTKVIRSEGKQITIDVTASLEAGPYRHRAQRTKSFSIQIPTK